ncbi:MAG: hypothetical protein AzoDbin1_05163, partial [Azoarcus sp.]|nr:hypothetical protein [Azoarcus sp.]
ESYYQQLYNQGNGFVIPDFYHMSNTSSQLVRENTERYRTDDTNSTQHRNRAGA